MLRDSLFRRALLLGDAFALLGAMVAASLPASHPSASVPLLLLVIVPLVISAKLLGLYDRDDSLLRKTTLEEAPKLFELATLCTLVAWLASGPIGRYGMTRHQAFAMWVALAVLLPLMRTVSRALALRMAPLERCLVVGDRIAVETISGKLSERRGGLRAEMVAHVDLDQIAPWSASAQSETRLDEVRQLAQALDVHRAIVAPTTADGGEVLDLVRTLKAVGVRVSVLPRLLEVIGSSVEFDDLYGMTLMGVRRFELTRSSALVKRWFDICCAGVALLVLAPLILIAAIAIKLDSDGSVLFRQRRVGRHGEHFYVLKFRTMVQNAEELKESLRDRNEAKGGMFKIADDPRITRVGKLLRKTALDELPQLFNVLKGEMSIVGPRPLVLEEDERVIGWHRRRLELTPGMTGPWQILGPSRVPLREMVSIDYLYVANWSLWNDAKIMLRTVCYVFCARGM
ncbi:MAG TPA: sugar transferase [Solirubrobacteraceae bacterium]|jgi:exopolysaccharide biosynthesis polyprenyl glycosylphosphotransferase|nr:sugar transferase [Solirubrobacteraceae bacterium]